MESKKLPLDEVETRLKEKIDQRVGGRGDISKGKLGLRRAFKLFQPHPETNEIDRDSFRQVLVSMGFTVKDALALFAKFDTNRNGALDMDEFARALLGRDSYEACVPLRHKPPSTYPKQLKEYLEGPDSHAVKDSDRIAAVKDAVREQRIQFCSLELPEAEQRLREKVLQRIGNLHNNAVGQLGLKRAFKMFDPQDEGVITPENFIKILENFGFAKKDAALIFQKYDQDKSGSIELREFQRLLMAPSKPQYSTMAMAEARQKAKRDAVRARHGTTNSATKRLPLEEVEARLRSKLEHRVGNVFNQTTGQLGEERAFSIFNPIDGRIQLREFQHVMQSFGFCEEDAIALFSKADINGSGDLDINEFRIMFFGRGRPRPATCDLAPQAAAQRGTPAWGARPSSQAGPRPLSRTMSRTQQRSGGSVIRRGSRAQSATNNVKNSVLNLNLKTYMSNSNGASKTQARTKSAHPKSSSLTVNDFMGPSIEALQGH